MALDEEGEKAAKRLAKMPEKLKQYPHNVSIVRELKTVLYDFDSEHSLEEIVDRARELAAAAPATTASARGGTGGGQKAAGAPSKARPKESSLPLEVLSQPYRFIDLPDRVVLPEPGMADHPIDEPLAEGYCGTISVEWIAETPLLIGGPATGKSAGDGTVEPLKIRDEYVLPGATLRGLTRSIAEIVAYAKMTQGNWHYRFGLRDFVHPYFVEDSGVSKVDQVKGGFLRIRKARTDDPEQAVVELNGERLIYELTGNLEWGHVRIPSLSKAGVSANLLQEKADKNRKGYPQWTGNLPFDAGGRDGKYTLLKMGRGESIDFAKQHSFRLVSSENNRQVYDVDPQGTKKGVMVVSGKLPGGGNKIYEYFITPNPSAPVHLVQKDTALLFERLHSRPGKGEKLEADGNWKTLRKLAFKDIGIPVFYVGNPDFEHPDRNFFFGLTRLFKVPHRRSVADVLYGEQPAHRPRIGDAYENVDFVENLFGYVVEPRDWLQENSDESVAPSTVARKGRVAFGFAPLSKATKAKLSNVVDVIQMAPRASYAPFYLRGQVKDYSGPKARIAGRKAYFPQFSKPDTREALSRFKAFGDKQRQDVIDASNKPPSPDTLSHLRFLVPEGDFPLVFTGEIRLENVTAAEIGAILYAITHGGDRQKRFRHMLGRGKPFGAGQMRIGRVRLSLAANGPAGADCIQPVKEEERFQPSSGHGFAEEGDLSLNPFLDAFEDYMRGQIGPSYPLQSAPICEWLGMSDPNEGETLASASRLFYKAYERDPSTGQPLKQFDAYRRLREATQYMNSPDQPRGKDRLLVTPKKTPSRG